MDEPTQKAGKPAVQATQPVFAWQLEDSAPEVVTFKDEQPFEVPDDEPEEDTRSWSDTFKAIGKYGALAALVALVGLMFLDDHLPHRHPAHQVESSPISAVFRTQSARELPSRTKGLSEIWQHDTERDEAAAKPVAATTARTRSVFISSDTANAGGRCHLSEI